VTRTATISRGARALVLAGAGFFVAAAWAALQTEPRATVVALALYGFVFHTLFGKAYSLLPSYFDRDLAFAYAPRVQVPLSVLGAAGLALPPDSPVAEAIPLDTASAGAALWAAGAGVFLLTIAATVRDNPTGADTGTSPSKPERARMDRAANFVMPVALAYLAVGSYELAARELDAPTLLDVGHAGTHVLAVGTASLLVFAVGARLLPRLLRADAPDALAGAVLAGGTVGPLLLVGHLEGGVAGAPETGLLHGAIVLLTIAVVGHAGFVGLLLARAPAPRHAAYGVLAGSIGGVATVGAGAAIALEYEPMLVLVHPRLGLLGFLGLTIVGVAFHFYPPSIAGEYGDYAADGVIVLVAAGLALELGAILAADGLPEETVLDVARGLVLLGAMGYAGLLALIFYRRG